MTHCGLGDGQRYRLSQVSIAKLIFTIQTGVGHSD